MSPLQFKKFKIWIVVIFIAMAWFLPGKKYLRSTSTEPSKENFFERVVNIPKFDAKIHSDGCSGGMSLAYSNLSILHDKFGNQLPWRSCCVFHDEAYYYGGTRSEKEKADKQLRLCVSSIIGEDLLGRLMEQAVKIGGQPQLPTSFRWGYGADF